MYFSHLLESDLALTIGKHTKMTKENSKGMKDVSASNVPKVTFQGSPYNAYTLLLHTQVALSKSRSEAITMPMRWFSNRTWLSSSVFNKKESNVIF